MEKRRSHSAEDQAACSSSPILNFPFFILFVSLCLCGLIAVRNASYRRCPPAMSSRSCEDTKELSGMLRSASTIRARPLGRVASVAVRHDGHRIISGAVGGSVRIWDIPQD